MLLGTQVSIAKALGYFAAAFVFVTVLTQAAIIAIGLPNWVLPGVVVLMLLGLPVILFTAYAQRVARRALTMTPTFTPGGTPSKSSPSPITSSHSASRLIDSVASPARNFPNRSASR